MPQNVNKVVHIILKLFQKDSLCSDNRQVFNLLTSLGALISGTNREAVLNVSEVGVHVDKYMEHVDER